MKSNKSSQIILKIPNLPQDQVITRMID